MAQRGSRVMVVSVDERAHRNLCDFTRFCARLDRGADLVELDGVVAAIGPADFPTARQAIRADDELDPAAWARTVDELFAAHGRTGCVFARAGIDDATSDELVTRGFREWATTPEMICDQALEPRTAPAGVTGRLAQTADDVAAYAQIAGRAFTHLSVPEEVTRTTVDNADVMLQPDCVIALADLDGTPVAGALVVLFDEGRAGYVGWVACVDEARGHGLGDVVTRAVTNEAFARGASLVKVEASPFGEHTYPRMGYREIYRYRMMIRL